MTGHAVFLTHAQVVIDPAVPVPDWPLNEIGRARHTRFARDPELANVTTLFCSDERKARDGAKITAAALGLVPRLREDLRENDRRSTGYLPRDRFEQMADRFFAAPDTSVLGWEPARDAQSRIVAAVADALSEARPEGDVLFIGHGGTAALLRCWLLKIPITRSEDQPDGGGGWFRFGTDMTGPPSAWSVM